MLHILKIPIINHGITKITLVKKLPEIYSKIMGNYAENMITVSRIFNDLVFSNVDSFKNIANTAKEHSKHLSEIGKRDASQNQKDVIFGSIFKASIRNW